MFEFLNCSGLHWNGIKVFRNWEQHNFDKSRYRLVLSSINVSQTFLYIFYKLDYF